MNQIGYFLFECNLILIHFFFLKDLIHLFSFLKSFKCCFDYVHVLNLFIVEINSSGLRIELKDSANVLTHAILKVCFLMTFISFVFSSETLRHQDCMFGVAMLSEVADV